MKSVLLFLLLSFSLSAKSNALVVIQSSLVPNSKHSDSKCRAGQCGTPLEVSLDMQEEREIVSFSIAYYSHVYPTSHLFRSHGPKVRLGGEQQIAEWMVEPIADKSPRAHSLSIQVDGIDPWTNQSVSEIFVFGFDNFGVCLRGREQSWDAARILAATSTCVKDLQPSKPYRITPIVVPR